MRRAAALAALAGLGVLCIGSGANRMALTASGASPRAAWFGHAADRTAAARAIADGRGDDAIAAARRIVRAVPVDRPALSLLGSASLTAGDAAGADAAFRVAGQLGWRDPATQLYWLAAALVTPDPAVAVQRADALLRMSDPPAAWDALRQLEADPAARPLLVQRLALAPEWLGGAIDRLGTLDGAAARRRVDLLIAARAAGLSPDRSVAATGAIRLVEAKQPVLAGRFWAAFMGPGDGGVGVSRHGFDTLRDGRVKAPFEWHPLIAAAVEMMTGTVSEAPGETVLQTRAFGNLDEPIAWRMLLLAPGRYVAEWRTGGGETLDLTVECDGGAPFTGAAQRVGATGRRLAFTVPAGCPAQFLRIVDRPPATPHDGGWMTAPRITPLRQGPAGAPAPPAAGPPSRSPPAS